MYTILHTLISYAGNDKAIWLEYFSQNLLFVIVQIIERLFDDLEEYYELYQEDGSYSDEKKRYIDKEEEFHHLRSIEAALSVVSMLFSHLLVNQAKNTEHFVAIKNTRLVKSLFRGFCTLLNSNPSVFLSKSLSSFRNNEFVKIFQTILDILKQWTQMESGSSIVSFLLDAICGKPYCRLPALIILYNILPPVHAKSIIYLLASSIFYNLKISRI